MGKRNRRRKKPTQQNSNTSTNIELFFTTILPFIENLEKEDKILLVLPNGNQSQQGIVIGDELSDAYTRLYVESTRALIEKCGGEERFFDRRLRDPKWYEKNNPDKELLALLQSARLVIAYRYGIQCGESGAEPKGLTDSPLFITMMGIDGAPTQVGYELNGQITLENYKSTEDNETTGSTTVAASATEEAEA